ncbi:hypothetical protein EBZ80_20830 [bacterium]|nr:hypothetical protein [bacterium]
MIGLDNLSDRDLMIAEILWEVETFDQVKELISKLPRSHQQQWIRVVNGIIAATFDNVDDVSEAATILETIRNKK